MPVISRDLSIVARCGMQFRSDRLAPFGLSAPQAPYILRLCNHPGMSQEQIARALHVNRSNVARQLAALEENGFIERRVNCHDKRLIEAYPTEKAQAVLPEVKRVNQEWNDYITAGMSQSETDQLEALLERIRERASSYTVGEDEQ